MSNQNIINLNEEDLAITKRILLKEQNIRILASKYLDFMNHFNSFSRNEMTQILNDILNEIDLIEINVLKAENIQKLKQMDKIYHINISEKLSEEISETKKEIAEYNEKLLIAQKEKNDKIEYEEIGKIINGYDTQETLNQKINKVEKENKQILQKTEMINNKLNVESNKMALLLSLVNDLKNNFDKDLDNIITIQEENINTNKMDL
jgi:hypothetical protein